MIYKYLLLFAISYTNIIANTSNVKITGQKFLKEKNITTAIGDIVFDSNKYKIQSDKIQYDQNIDNLEFFDNVKVDDKENNISLNAKYLKAILKDDYLSLKDTYLVDNTNNLWMKSSCGEKKQDIFILEDTLVSSCQDRDNPFWKIKFEKGEYDNKEEKLILNNAIFYVKTIPIAYTPYLSLPTGDKQKSGFLTPELALFGNFAYMQPIFFIIKENIDLEITPYVRLKQGFGAYTTTRFMDTNHSQGSFTIGAFKDSSALELERNDFYGVEFDYTNNIKYTEDEKSLFSIDVEFFDNLSYMNFKTLDALELQLETISASKIAYIYQNKNWSIDTQIKNIKNTKRNSQIQLLPAVKIDKTRSFIFDNLSYKFDYRMQYQNKEDSLLNPLYQEATLPHFYSLSMLDGFANINIENEIKFTRQDYFKDNKNKQSETSVQDYINLEVSSKLAKIYSDFMHNIDLSLYMRSLVKDFRSDSFILPDGDKDKIGFEFKQYFVNDGENLLSHSINQEIHKDNESENFNNFGDTTSYIKYQKDNISIYNKSNYSIQKNEILYLSTNLEIEKYNTKMLISHLFENNKNDIDDVNYVGANIKSKASNSINLEFDIQINQKTKETKKWSSSIEYLQDCWGYILKFGQNNIPNLNYQTSQYIDKNNIIYFQVKFNPIGGISHSYYF